MMAEGRDQQEMQRRYQDIVSDFDQVDQKLIQKVRQAHELSLAHGSPTY